MRRPGGIRPGTLALGVCLLAAAGRAGTAAGEDASIARGKELFAHEWLPADARSRGGDGLGPVYNDTSCVACHNLGAPGGGGAAGKNTDIITAVPKRPADQPGPEPASGPAKRPEPDELVKLHGGFRTARSTLLHRFGTDPDYFGWRFMILRTLGNVDQHEVQGLRAGSGGIDAGRIAMVEMREGKFNALSARLVRFTLVRSQRNPPALFGAGRIDAIPDRAIEQAADHRDDRFPEVIGRVGRLKDGRIGRFGWKAQTATLEDSVLSSCAGDLGLEVPGRHQAGLPAAFRSQRPAGRLKSTDPAPRLDLSAEECAALVAYIRSLPAPTMRLPSAEPGSRRDPVGPGGVRAGRLRGLPQAPAGRRQRPL